MPPGATERYDVFNRSIRSLKEYQSRPLAGWEKDFDQCSLIERLLQKAIEVLIDLGTHLIAQSRWQKPAKAAEIFEVLRVNGVLEKDLGEKMRGRVRLRNIIIHEYATLSAADLHEAISDLSDLLQVASILARKLDLSAEI